MLKVSLLGSMIKALLRWPSVQALMASLLGRYLAFALRTTRWTLQNEAQIAARLGASPVVTAFWHERLSLMPALWSLVEKHGAGHIRAYVLVSRHHDGRFIGEIVRRFNLELVYGSTSRNGQDRGGAAGARTLLSVLEEGNHVAITPDGPRGPRHVAAPGVAQLAARSSVPVMPCAAQTSWRLTLPTWDRMVLPLPFGRGVIVCGDPIGVLRDEGEAALPRIEAAMTAALEEADRQCP
jgi:lysophospholipid acyltransferase (LPLAT)-like uncharacterized protein